MLFIFLKCFLKISSLSGDTTLNWRTDSSSSASTAGNNQISEYQSSGIPIVDQAETQNPSIYQELKLGHKGAGFKRLVS